MCGLCAPRCPTYQLAGTEMESPRGRIALMNAIWRDQLSDITKATEHLDNCLACRSCEAICPADVPYDQLLRATRHKLRADQQPNRIARLGLWLIQHKRMLRAATTFTRWLQNFGVLRLIRHTPLARKLNLRTALSAIPELKRSRHWRKLYPRTGNGNARVALFTGCVSDLMDPDAVTASIRLLTAAGYEVEIPREQTCCGSLHAHQGDTKTAQQLTQRNAEAFSTATSSSVISLHSGCTAFLQDCAAEQSLLHDKKFVDAGAFIAALPLATLFRFAPLKQRVLIHVPCTQRNVVKKSQAATELLRAIPELELQVLNAESGCCGAAGSYFLTHETTAQQLGNGLIDRALEWKPDIIATTNIGCALQLQHILRSRGHNVEVLHPVTLLERQRRETIPHA